MVCEHPRYWDFGELACKDCPKQQIYDIFDKQCEYCPASNPFFNGEYCTICLNNQFYNHTSLSCSPCTGDKVYDAKKMLCVCPSDHPF